MRPGDYGTVGQARLQDLDEAIRTYIAWKSIHTDMSDVHKTQWAGALNRDRSQHQAGGANRSRSPLPTAP
jgi:hypothetical protein